MAIDNSRVWVSIECRDCSFNRVARKEGIVGIQPAYNLSLTAFERFVYCIGLPAVRLADPADTIRCCLQHSNGAVRRTAISNYLFDRGIRLLPHRLKILAEPFDLVETRSNNGD
jgi:hypothetical protein